ncbi:hypothetical protein D3C75_732830 [compost metagenome]
MKFLLSQRACLSAKIDGGRPAYGRSNRSYGHVSASYGGRSSVCTVRTYLIIPTHLVGYEDIILKAPHPVKPFFQNSEKSFQPAWRQHVAAVPARTTCYCGAKVILLLHLIGQKQIKTIN